MKPTYVFYIALAGLLGSILFTRCKYDTDIPNPEDYTQVYMPQAAKNPLEYDLTMSDTLQTIIYGANYGGTGYPDKDIQVAFKADTTLIDSFNIKNGTNYLPMPAGSYQLGETSAVIPKGKLSTDPLKLKIKTIGALESSVGYLLPVRIMQAGNDSISSDLGTTYFVIRASYEVADIFMSEGGNEAVPHSLNNADTAQTISFKAEYTGDDPESDVTVSFKADTTLTDSFNLRNGTNYLSLPAGSYELPQTSAIIPKGATTSSSLPVKIKTKGYLVPFQSYLLPVRIDAVTGSLAPSKKLSIDPGKSVTYFLITATRDGIELTIMCYAKNSGSNDLAAIANDVAAYKPDLLLIRQLDVNTTRSGPADQPKELARLLNMPYYVFANALDYQGGQYGCAVFSRFPIDADSTHTYMLSSTSSEKGPVAITQVKIQDSLRLYFAGVHLNANAGIRNTQTSELLNMMKDYNGPLILAGDFNDAPNDANGTSGQMETQFTFPCHSCPPTYPSSGPTGYSEYIMYKSGSDFTTLDYQAAPSSASNYLPVILKVKWYY